MVRRNSSANSRLGRQQGNPLNDTSGVLSVDFQGNLVLRRGNGSTLLWSTNVSLPSVPSISSPVVRLLDSGNLFLYENAEENFIRWRSFDFPTNIHLPYMRFGMKRTSSFSWSFTSWRSYNDSQPGNCTYKIDTAGYPQAVTYKDGRQYFQVGSWTDSRWGGLAKMDPSEEEWVSQSQSPQSVRLSEMQREAATTCDDHRN
ncbi:hypothetical protein MLD38_021981 [Melastoma candidum]|uniref:Uncharacterized protein n=1 Tax=Melastoma candidum TaxID=119954 RepID=A0ACB9QH60_9MYRT|nr:hypothetical protein MLD38_021981 [Melastoma candidum]